MAAPATRLAVMKVGRTRPEGPRRTPVRYAAGVGTVLVALAALTACAPDEAPDGGFTFTPTPSATTSATPTPTATAAAQAEIPTDCRAILNADVLAQLEGVPLNDPAFGASGPQPDGSLICVWGDPTADATNLVTTITYVSRGPALEQLNKLADDEGFTCYTPDSGTRCEKTWQDPDYPVTSGRTLYWRDGVLIDTRYSHLAPTGYTTAVVAAIYG